MSKQAAQPQPSRPLLGFLLTLSALAVALADAIYLLVNHIQHKRGGALIGFCDISATYNCRGAIESDFSMLLNVPVPVWAIAFYVTLLLLVLRSGPPRGEATRPSWSLVAVALAGATLYSLFLLYQLFFVIGTICPGCLVLDACNLIALTGAVLVVRLAPGRPLAWIAANLRAGLRSGVAFALVYAAVFLAGALVAREQLADLDRGAPVALDAAYDIVEGYPDRHVRVEIPEAFAAPVRGSVDAPVTIVEFSDFECPYCKRFSGVLEELLAAHPEAIQIRFLNYPLHTDCNPHVNVDMHPSACRAARAAACAADQGRFWELHDLLFENSTHLDRESILGLVASLRLDPDEFGACWESDYSLERVLATTDAGDEARRAAGAEALGTPYSFVNGLLVRGARRYNELEALVLREQQRIEGTGEGSGVSAGNP